MKTIILLFIFCVISFASMVVIVEQIKFDKQIEKAWYNAIVIDNAPRQLAVQCKGKTKWIRSNKPFPLYTRVVVGLSNSGQTYIYKY